MVTLPLGTATFCGFTTSICRRERRKYLIYTFVMSGVNLYINSVEGRVRHLTNFPFFHLSFTCGGTANITA